MSEGLLSWKRAAYWPRFEVGPGKGWARNLLFLLFLYLSVLWGYNAVINGWTRGIALIFGFYALCGALWWIVLMTIRLWSRFTSTHPKVARVLDTLSLIFAWEFRVLVEKETPKWLQDWWMFLSFATGAASYARRYDYISQSVCFILLGCIEALTRATGVYLAYRERTGSERKEE